MVLGQLEVKPGKLAEFRQVADQLVSISRAEPGTLGYEWYTADNHTFHVFERFASSEALLAHLGNLMPVMPSFLATADIRGMSVHGNSSPAVRDALGGFGARFMTQALGFSGPRAPTQSVAKNLARPDETRSFPHGRLDLVKVGDLAFGKFTLEPGWRWSEHVKPVAKTEACQVHHNGYIVSGRMRVRMQDGSEIEVGPGDVFVCPPGHDAWIVGSEPCVCYDFSGALHYAT
jgi:quercetin dioxygenase-like cupin family protein